MGRKRSFGYGGPRNNRSGSLPIAGGVVGGIGALQQRVKSEKRPTTAADQLEQQGRAEFAAAQRDAIEAKYQADLVTSRQIAVAAASGGGARGCRPS